jgi:sulfoxide reductase heme-binding subunit YedZ
MDRKLRDRLVYWAVWLGCASPLFWLVWLGFTDGLTANPIEKIIRSLGDDGLYILIIGLAITPAARILRQPRLIRFRRTVGLWGFSYICLHLLMYVGVDQALYWDALFQDILKRPFITIGMAAFILLIPLAVTSTNGMVRRLGPQRWRRLHQLIYLIVPLGVVHYLLMVKLDTRPPMMFGAVVAALLAWRAINRLAPGRAAPKRRRPAKAEPAATAPPVLGRGGEGG